ncbi:nucleobindin 1 isoform X2 [Andrena cerasifolii]|uniref:nucleobindin 1 isoform X2 n=1 Tax=Andrena cerasifolii TaxID=2819439 RepID=UPI0040376BE3
MFIASTSFPLKRFALAGSFEQLSHASGNMQYFLLFVLLSVVVQLSVAPPVNQKAKDGEHDSENEIEDVEERDDIMEYRRYLMEVVQVLESDQEFRAKLEKANDADIHTGKIAEELQFVNHNVRTRLDEIKREELERLRHLATKEHALKEGLQSDHLKVAEHLDHTNTRTFEISDLKRLIAKTAKDLAEADRKRREEFKEQEMEKEFEEQEKLKHMDEAERKKYEEEIHELKERQKKHDPVHHPGSKQQLEEVWEKQDHMDGADFNPKTFFFMHDIDGNGVWDQNEVKVLFLKELDKLYAQGTPQQDLLKRAEEMERMREHVFNEADFNKDGLISYDEFFEQTRNPDFQKDEGWQPLDEQQIYTHEEFEAFERHKQEEIQKLIAKGMFPPQYAHAPIPPQQYMPGRDPNQQLPHQQQFQDQNNPQYQQPHGMAPQQQYPNVPVQQLHGQVPPQQYQPQHQQFQGQLPPNQQYQQMQPPQPQVPVQQLNPGSVPVQQHPGQVPVQQHQNPVPAQQQQGEVPAQQNTANQVPQNAQHNAAPQQTNPSQPNSQPAQASAHQDVARNQVKTDEQA